MATQTELVAQLSAVNEKVVKVGGETRTLINRIEELTNLLDTQPGVTPELQAAVAALSEQVNIVDALVPDAEPAA